MRISDWSSDVCSSDLLRQLLPHRSCSRTRSCSHLNKSLDSSLQNPVQQITAKITNAMSDTKTLRRSGQRTSFKITYNEFECVLGLYMLKSSLLVRKKSRVLLACGFFRCFRLCQFRAGRMN